MDSIPNLFSVPPGVDFAVELIAGIDRELGPDPMAAVNAEIWVNTERTRRRLLDVYHAGPAGFIPKIRLVTELLPLTDGKVEKGVSAIRRRLELRPLVARALELNPQILGASSVLDLTESLALLLTEMADEGVSAGSISSLDVSDTSGHWQNSLRFLTIAANAGLQSDAPSMQRQIAQTIVSDWARTPPTGPVFLAGSTGSRGPVSILMRGLLGFKNGYVILPGFDCHMAPEIWASLDKSSSPEDHPQYRFAKLLDDLGLTANDVRPWTDQKPPAENRNQLLSLALRPAPMTDGWLRDGPNLPELTQTCETTTLIEAKSPRAEAGAIAMRLRAAVEHGKTAALITPDRTLARRVAVALDAWGIVPDDSAGLPLDLTAQGRLLLQTTQLFCGPPKAEALIALLSNPVTSSGKDRKTHLEYARSLELFFRDRAVLFPTSDIFEKWCDDKDAKQREWVDWANAILSQTCHAGTAPLSTLLERLLDCATLLASGPGREGSGILWEEEAGNEAGKAIRALQEVGEFGGSLSPIEFEQLLRHHLAQSQARDALSPHPNVMIWGTLEARVQAVDVAILGGLNEGTWPKAPDPDPWLSRQMRRDAGLLSPERRIGLSAHDFQSAAGAKEVVFSRAIRDDDAMTVPSRWLNRLTNLLAGLPKQGGQRALDEMRERGMKWIAFAQEAEHQKVSIPPEPRPSPVPPASVRPRKLSVTQIQTLVRDPYEIYARKILRLEPLNALRAEPDARLRGQLFHKVLEIFVRNAAKDPTRLSSQELGQIARDVFSRISNWPAEMRAWQANVAATADQFVSEEKHRWKTAIPTYFEVKGNWRFRLPSGQDFRLTGIADRIDLSSQGGAWVFDYKTGAIPGAKQQKHFDKQLFILGLMAEAGAFSDPDPIPPIPLSGVGYLGVGRKLARLDSDLVDYPLNAAQADLFALLDAYLDGDQGYSARAKAEVTFRGGDFDHLARRGEWDETTPTTRIRVGS